MAKEIKSLPKFPENRWWQLRNRFHQTLPKAAVDANYLSTIFDIGELAAKNLISPLRQLGLLDEDNKHTELSNAWRHDDTYATACNQMLESVYPDELRDVAPGPDVNKAQAATWISKHLTVGHGAARAMAALYALIAEGDPEKEGQKPQPTGNADARTGPAKRAPQKQNASAQPGKTPVSDDTPPQDPAGGTKHKSYGRIQPTVHVDIQIHISPEATNEQIEKIFQSMGKHIFGGAAGE